MRLARWRDGSTSADGIVVGDRLVPLPAGLRNEEVVERGLAEAVDLGERLARAVPADAIPTDSAVLLAPLRAPSIRDFVAFEEHVEGVTVSVDGAGGVVPQWYEAPTFYFTNPHSLIGSEAVVHPPRTDRLDFELEVAAIIGGVPSVPAVSLRPEDAEAHVFGYAIFNDWSARDVQSREMQVRLGPCKGKDFASTLGPWITTADEVADRLDRDGFLDLEMVVEVNDVEIGRDSLSNMSWPFRDLIAYASRNSIVVPGDVLGSGTAGSGCLAELWGRAGALEPEPLRAGDRVTMRVERLGSISNVVGSAVEVPPIPPARRRPGSPAARLRRTTVG